MLPQVTATPFEQSWMQVCGHLRHFWVWLQAQRQQRRLQRRLCVAETLSFGDKRFVSILQVDGAQFLIGGAGGNLSLLATLERPQEFGSLLKGHPGAPLEQL